jgi:hypothetical protein
VEQNTRVVLPGNQADAGWEGLANLGRTQFFCGDAKALLVSLNSCVAIRGEKEFADSQSPLKANKSVSVDR